MQSSRVRQRFAATALLALAVGAGAVTTAAPAVAGDGSTIFGKDNTVAIGDVALAPDKAVSVDVTYSCDATGDPLHLGVTWRLADERDSDIRSPRGVATVQHSALTCDANKHGIQVTVPVLLPEDSLPFGVGDPVEVMAQLANPEGAPYAKIEKVSTL
ncbi:hypothetical protein GCM10018793_23050 [Streptomyces sulfonofaciens]|uniref:Ig-like domain-containing protein n=1 Tax=Streptomyces sulfonofaciens TaxID=68272 RepID=A0A919G241_9ACTN|nr:hypothetical protein [Streptomyces sulfonofaciens]GHH76703.1 hypothetical protein GCM10018793_23050 [Streptomyces sulfonofaciens]